MIFHDQFYILTLASDRKFTLDASSKNLFQFLTDHPTINMEDLAYSLNVFHSSQKFRKAMVCSSREDALSIIQKNKKTNLFTFDTSDVCPVILYFPALSGNLMEIEKFPRIQTSAFYPLLNSVLDLAQEISDYPIKSLFFSKDNQKIHDISFYQLASFVLEYALAQYWMGMGVRSDYSISHCFGELVASVIYKAVPIEDMLVFLTKTSNAIKQLPSGYLLLAFLENKQPGEITTREVEISIHYPGNVVLLSCPENVLHELMIELSQKKIHFKKLNIPCFFHSSKMTPIYNQLCSYAKSLTVRQPVMSYFASSIENEIDISILSNPTYWANIYCQPIDMISSLQKIKEKFAKGLILELGLGQSVHTVFHPRLFPREQFHVLGGTQSESERSEVLSLYWTLAKLWVYGINIRWDKFYQNKDVRLLPVESVFSLKKHFKLQKKEELFINVTHQKPRTQYEKILYSIFKNILNLKKLNIDDNFYHLGGDSLLALQCIAKAHQKNIMISLEDFLKYPTVKSLASRAKPITFENDFVDSIRELPLLPLQVKFFRKPRHWKEAKLLSSIFKLNVKINKAQFKMACQKLMDYHEALRLRFAYRNGVWKQYLLPKDHIVFREICDTTPYTARQRMQKLFNIIKQREIQFDLERGPLIRFELVDLGKSHVFFILFFHHLCLDGLSLQLLVQDLEFIYSKTLNEQENIYPPPRHSLRKIVKNIYGLAKTEFLERGYDFWAHELKKPYTPLPIDYERHSRLLDSTHVVEYRIRLDKKTTSLLLKEPPRKMHGIGTFDVLIAAFILLLNDFSGGSSQLIDLRKHGRDGIHGIDLTNTVGWFTSVHPINLHLDSRVNFLDAIQSVHDQLNSIPNNGFTYNLLHYLNRIKDHPLSLFPQAEIAFNYHGQVDRLFGGNSCFHLIQYPIGNYSGTKATKSHLIDVNVLGINNAFNIIWTYNTGIHKKETIVQLAKDYRHQITELLSALRNS